MAELDVETLKQLGDEPFASFTPLEMADWANDVQRQLPAIIAALLEDRDRLRAALEDVRQEIDRQLRLAEVPQLNQIRWWRNRLEGRDG